MAREINEQEFRLIDGVSRGLVGIASGLKGLKTTMTELNQAAELASKGIGLVVGAAQKIGDSVQGVADYQTAMTRVNTATKATAEEQRALSESVKSAAIDIGVTAETSSNILLKMARDGFSAQEAIDQLGVVLNYAKANAQDAAGATAQLGGVLDSFNEKPQIVGALADSLTAVGVAAGTEASNLAAGLQGVGVAANEAGLSLNETIVLLGLLAKRNIEGGAATKQLVTLFGEFRDPASKAGQALDGLGLSGKSFSEVISVLSKNSSAATEVLNQLGNKPRAALNALLADGGGALKEFNGIIATSGGASKKAADALADTFNEAKNKLVATFGLLEIAFGAPLLKPLSDGLDALTTKLIEFSQSPEFANLTTQFTTFATNATTEIIGFLKEFDFTDATNKAAEFVRVTAENLNTLATAAGKTASAINTAAKGFEVAWYAAQTAVAGAAASTVGAFAGVSENADNLSRSLADVADTAKRQTGEAMGALVGRFDETGKAATRAAGGVGSFGKASKQAALDLQALAIAALPEPLRIVAQAAIDAQAGLIKAGEAAAGAGVELGRIPEAPVIVRTGDAAKQTAVSIAELEAELAKLNEQLQKAPVGSPQFTQLQQQISDLQYRIKNLKGGTDGAGTSVQNFGNSAGNAAGQVQKLGDDTEGASQKVENFGKNAAAAAFNLGKMSTEFLAQTTSAANAQASYRNYLEVLNLGTAIAKDQIKQFERRLELSQQTIRANDEEALALDRLAKAYPAVSRDALRELYEAEKKIADIRKKKNEITAKGLELEQASAQAASGTAGALGFGARPAQADGRAATQAPEQAGPGSSVKGSVVNINVSGILTDELAREIAERVQRVQRLGR